MRASERISRVLVGACLALLMVLATPVTADQPEPQSLGSLKASVENTSLAGHLRADAAEAIAEGHFEPDALLPWLRERLEAEGDFHVKLALAYAQAAQGEIAGLRVLIDALEQTGHLGYVYLQRVSEQRIGGPGVGWDRPAWVRWRDSLTPDGWKELQRKKHLPRVASDAGAEGFAKAIAWWDGLGFPDTAKLDFVRYTAGGLVDLDDTSKRTDVWEYGFLLKEDAVSFTILETSLHEPTHMRKPPKGEDLVRFERLDLAKEVAQQLDALASGEKGGIEIHESDVFGVDYYQPTWRFQGFLLARALAARGAQDLALKVWQHVAGEPDSFQRHGAWSAVTLLQKDTAARMMDLWEIEVADPARTWAQALEGFKRWRTRFDAGGDQAESEAVLVKMATEEAGYAAAAQAADKDPAERARRLVLGLPTVREPPYDAKPRPEDARTRLEAIGYAAVPALRAGLEDARFTKTLDVGFGHKGWMRPWVSLARVRNLALRTLEVITQQEFEPGEDKSGWAAVGEKVDAWWKEFQAKGESGVLREGVRADNPAAAAQARRLAERYPAEAFEPIRKAIEAAEVDLAADLVNTLTPLARPEVQAFLLQRAKEGPLLVRMAAAEALHAQKKGDGLASLLGDLPTLLKAKPISDDLPSRFDRAPQQALELLLRLDPARTLPRVREILPDLAPAFRMAVLGKIPLALGYWPSYTPKRAADRPQPPAVWKEAEALVIALVLDDGERLGRTFVNASEESNIVGEVAAERAAELWPKRYVYDPAASLEARVAARYAIVNAWRKTAKLPPVAPPGAPPPIAPADPKAAKDLIDAWLAAAPGEARTAAEAAIWAQGLRMLPALKSARKSVKEGDERFAALDLLVRRTANLLREAVWSKDGPQPNEALKSLVDGMVGKPLAGREVLGILQRLAKDTPDGAQGIDLQIVRNGNGTGCVLTLKLTTEVVSWRGGDGGWILSDSGLEHVDGEDLVNLASWWHETRGPQLDEDLLLPEGKDVRVRRTLARARG